MSKNGFMKERTLDKLREESSTIYQGTRLIVFLNALFAITCIIMLVLSFVFSSTVTEMRSDTAHRGFPFIVHTFAYLVTSGDVYTETGAFNYGYYILSMAAQLFSTGIIAYIFHTISRVFKSILDGGTPFVDTCITEWKRCYRFLPPYHDLFSCIFYFKTPYPGNDIAAAGRLFFLFSEPDL